VSSAESDPLVGARLGRYEVLARLGQGGMGVVYRARDLELEREVALKVLLPAAVADPEARATLLREARTASHLNHPHVCTIYEVGQDGGHVFVAMELVEGRALREVIPPVGLPDETVVRYAAQIARALAHAHERRVVHRDLKTANVVIGPSGHAKLLDFGLSRHILDESAASATSMATTDVVAGTPQYLAPEVLMGERAGPHSDIWSLGVVIHEMCSGSIPFAGGSMASVVTAILHTPPPALPAHTGAGLRAVVMRCLAKEPAQRYPSADEVAAALEALLPGTLAEHDPSRRRGHARSGPVRRWLVPLGAVAIAAAAWWQFAGPARDVDATVNRTILILPMEVRGQVRDADFAGRALAEALAVNLAQAAGVRVMPVPATGELWNVGAVGRARAALLAGAGRLVLGALTRDGDSLRVSVSLVDTRANEVLWGTQRTAGAGDLSLLASSLAAPLAAHLGARSARRYDYFMYETGPSTMAGSLELTEAIGAVRRYELSRSLESTHRLVQRFPREPDAHVLRVAALLIELVARGPDAERIATITGALDALHRLDPGNPWHDAAQAMLMPPGPSPVERLGRVAARSDLTPAARGALLAMRADKLVALGDTAAAIADGEQAVQLDPASDLSLSTLARALTRAGRHADAARRVRQAVALNPTVVNYWLQLGNCMLKQGQWQEYVADLDRAAALSPETDAILSAQSDGLSCTGHYREAADCARRALRLRPERWHYGAQLAHALLRQGEWTEALPLLDRACSAGSAADCPVSAAAHAVTLQRSGDAAAAAARAQQAAAGPESKSSRYALACYQVSRGDRDAAIALMERFPAMGWIEPALDRDPNLAPLRSDARFRRIASWMQAQPIDRVFAEWGRSQ
jgi:tetratricopeptide (TPR) repeat protein/TolB-like protein